MDRTIGQLTCLIRRCIVHVLLAKVGLVSSRNSVVRREGFGDNLRLQLRNLGVTQAELAEAAGVSRSTISRAINEDLVSPPTEEKIRVSLAQFAEGGASPEQPGRRTARPGRGFRRTPPWATLCTVTDLEAWADSRNAQAELPRLVRKLIHETGREVSLLSMRAGESVALGGWDGLTASGSDHPWIPQGRAVWEMGVSRVPATKARNDLTKRTESLDEGEPGDSTFVFVTPRRWEGKHPWAARHSSETPWKEIRVIDGDDLEAWLEEAPATHVWLSRIIGTLPDEVTDLEGFWEDWSLATNPPVCADLLSAGREGALSELREHIQAGASPLTITAESRDEAIALTYCAVQGFEPETRESFLARCVVVESETPLRALSGRPGHLVLVVRASVAAEAVAAASRAGHLVIVPRDPGEGEAGGGVTFPSLDRMRTVEFLQKAGLSDEEARRLAAVARRSVSAFRRQRLLGRALATPGWARPDVARTVLPPLLLGEWNESYDGDREALAILARANYEDVTDSLTRWSEGQDPVLRRKGNHWYLVSREDSWFVLARYLREADLSRMASLALECFSEVDPSLQLPPEQRWMAGALVSPPRFSHRVRRGLAGTLALLGARGELEPGSSSHADFAARTVGEILRNAGGDWARWASMAPVLPRFAEAAPDVFLDMIEEATSGPTPVLQHLFSDGRSYGPFGPSSPHTHLLWALECLAWSPGHFSRVCALVAALDRIDPGSPIRPDRDREGRLSNRPFASLTSFFRPWLPQTSAPLANRLDALDHLRDLDEEAAWAVALSMLPEHHGSATRNAVPEFREWTADPFRRPQHRDVVGAWKEALSRLLLWVRTSGPRWAELIRVTDRLPQESIREVLDRLKSLDRDGLEEAVMLPIWEALRKLVGRHRKFRNAKWALPSELVEEVDQLRRRFEPENAHLQAAWLFSHDPDLPDGSGWDDSSFEERSEAIEAARKDAVAQLISVGGEEGVLGLVTEVEDPFALGVTVGQVDADVPFVDRLIARFLSTDLSAHSRFVTGIASGRTRTRGDEWLDSAIEGRFADLSSEQKGMLLLLKPCTSETWRVVDSFGSGAIESYWRLIRIYAVPPGAVEEAATRLLGAKRPFAAVELLAMHLRRKAEIPTDIIVQVLTAAVDMKEPVDRPQQSFSYSLGGLLDELEESGADTKVIARLEWATLPALRVFERRPRVLHRFMAEDPEFFVELVRLAFRAEGEEPVELSKEERARSGVAYQLLESWKTVPGTAEDGRIGAEVLSAWLERARGLLEEEGRLGPGDRIIGQMFSRSTGDPDGSFPASPIRRTIEKLASPRLEDGLYLGVINGRGVTTRLPHDGGGQERLLAEKYEGIATAIGSKSPRTAAVMRRVANSYRSEAAREDLSAELSEDSDW